MLSSLIALTTLMFAQTIWSNPFVKPGDSPNLPPVSPAPTSAPEYDALNPIAACAAITLACDLCLAEFDGAVLFCEVFEPGCSVCFPMGWPCLCLLGAADDADSPTPHVDPPASDAEAATSLVNSVSASLVSAGGVTPETGLPINNGNPAFGVNPPTVK